MWRLLSGSSTKAKSTIFVHDLDTIEVRAEDVEFLKRAAAVDPLGRARLCLHRDHQDNIQQMVIAYTKDSLVRPHRHQTECKSYHVIEGELSLVIFDDSGQVMRTVHMGRSGKGRSLVCRFSDRIWHTVIPHTDIVVIHETREGPFRPEDQEFPEWAPDESDPDAMRDYLDSIYRSQKPEQQH